MMRYVAICLKRLCPLISVLAILLVPIIHYYAYSKILHGFQKFQDIIPVRISRSQPVYLSMAFELSGIGNTMFQYAALFGLAKRTNRVAVISSRLHLLPHLHLTVHTSNAKRPGQEWGQLVEFHASRYDETFLKVLANSDVDLEMVGYFQSWMYFKESFEDIRREFKFSSAIRSQVSSLTMEVRGIQRTSGKQSGSSFGNGTLIGVHVRRGDMLSDQCMEFGYTVADVAYLERAMEWFESKKFIDIRFIVVSDDIDWCLDNIPTSNRVVWFSEDNDALTDLALLAECDHVIMTVGTFGWWGAWLSGGQVVYYNNFPRQGSQLAGTFSETKADYFPVEWTGL